MVTKALLVSLATLQGVQAWGTLGHATVAYIAQNYVTSDAKAWAQDVLGDTSASYLANIASWADTYRTTTAGKFSAAFHYIDAEDTPPTSCNVNYDRDCGSAGCSVSAIANYTQRVGDGRLSNANVQEALKFLVHFIGDITQPLHDEALATGGNDITVTFDGYTNDSLHSDWDTYIPEKLIGGDSLSDALSWATSLTKEIESGDYSSLTASWIAGDDIVDAITTATRWASDANALVCSVVMPDGVAALQEGDLYPIYYNSVIPTVELQIAKAGYRLGNWLNMVYSQNIVAKHKRSTVSYDNILPPPRPLSKAKLARMALDSNCGGHRH